MLNLKFFALLAVISVASCEVRIPENFKNAKPISAHPRYQEHELQKKFAKNLSNNGEISPFIIGGQPAERGQFPHHALIYIVHPGSVVYLCGGSIIDQKWILTAAHCAYGAVQSFEIFLGVVDFNGPVSWYGTVYPQDVIIHQDYDDSTLINDIAMIKLVDAPEDLFFDSSVAPISLPFEYYDLVNQTGTVIGFGRESDNSSAISEVLKFNTLNVITNEECASYYVPGVVHETNLCAETNSEASTCGGDSGGSYIFNINGFSRLEGVTSFGAANGCQLGYPVGFTRVTSYINWIYNNINGVNTTTSAPEVDSWWKELLRRILEILKKIFGRP
ncbi:hypothetical protein ACKWTF_010700 [Chironomus riparius]